MSKLETAETAPYQVHFFYVAVLSVNHFSNCQTFRKTGSANDKHRTRRQSLSNNETLENVRVRLPQSRTKS